MFPGVLAGLGLQGGILREMTTPGWLVAGSWLGSGLVVAGTWGCCGWDLAGMWSTPLGGGISTPADRQGRPELIGTPLFHNGFRLLFIVLFLVDRPSSAILSAQLFFMWRPWS